MKLFNFSIVFLLATFIYSCSNSNEINKPLNISNSAREIGDESNVGKIDENGQMVITAEKEEIINLFKELSKEQGLTNVSYDTIFINKGTIESNNEIYYGLYAMDKTGNLKSAIDLNLINNQFYINGKQGSISCSSNNCCSSCCLPIQESIANSNVKYWTCTSCSTTCTKTASVTIKKSLSVE